MKNIETLQRQICFLKNHAEFPVANEEGIRIARLMPINKKTLKDFDGVSLLMSKWRNMYVDSFLTHFHATPEKTENWLNTLLIPREDKILFLIVVENDIVGHIGLTEITCQSAEIDNVINNHRKKNFFFNVLKTVIMTAFDLLDIEKVVIKYLSNNERAMRAYQKIFGTTVAGIDYLKHSENGFAICSHNESNTDIRYLTSEVKQQDRFTIPLDH